MFSIFAKPHLCQLSVALFFGICMRLSAAADQTQNGAQLTADALLSEARNTFNRGDWARASSLYEQFLEGYSKAPEVQGILGTIRYDLAIAYLRAANYERAQSCISAVLAQPTAITEIQKRELTFWLGICEFQQHQYEQARNTLETSIKLSPTSNKIPEARLIIATTYILQENFAAAADYLEQIDWPAEIRGRAILLHFHALLQLAHTDRALALVKAEYPKLGDIPQLITFHVFTLQLGAMFLEADSPRNAIFCFQRVWPSERLLRHQEQRLSTLEARLQSLRATRPFGNVGHSNSSGGNAMTPAYEKLQLSQLIAKIHQETAQFQKMEHFDSALQLRLATAYQAMGRYREAGLILERMLNKMQPDPIIEQASINLIQCWMQTERWPKAIEVAQGFVKKFPESESLAHAFYLQGVSAQKVGQYNEALSAFDAIESQHPASDFAPRAQFMRGFTLLLAERNPDAIEAFETFLKRYEKHELVEAAMYWHAMAYSLDSQFETARKRFDILLERFPNGPFTGSAMARKAYAAHQLMDFETSLREHNAFLKQFPTHEQGSEARVLLGDAYMNEGEMEKGIEVLKQIDPKDNRFFEEGWFKVGKALKLMEDYQGLQKHMQQFCDEHPQSPRVVEALSQIAWVLRQKGELDEARRIYWNAIAKYGDDPSIRSLDDLFSILQRFYREDLATYLTKLRVLETGSPVLCMRSRWAQAQALRKSDPEQANHLLISAAHEVPLSEINPMLLADFANAFRQSGEPEKAAHIDRELLKWNPRAPQAADALAELGLFEYKNGNPELALSYFHRFHRLNEQWGGSRLSGKVLLAEASMEADQGSADGARKSLAKLLAIDGVSGEQKAEALFRIGELYRQEGRPGFAIPYYQRVYVLYGRWHDWVAKAYLRSAEAFELLSDHSSARRTYEELVSKDNLVGLPESKEAERRLARIGGEGKL